jgi:hypothetical protein
MPTYRRMKAQKEADDTLKQLQAANRTRAAVVQPVYPANLQRIPDDVSSLSPANVLQLQRRVGNRAVEQLLKGRTRVQVAETGPQSIQRSVEEEEELMDLVCPGSKIRSGGQGRGEGVGGGEGPIGSPKDEEWE